MTILQIRSSQTGNSDVGQSVHVLSVATLLAIFSLMKGPEISSTASNRKDQVGGKPLSLYRPLCHSWRALRQPMGFCWRDSTVRIGTPSLTASLPQTGTASQTPSSPASDGVRSVGACVNRRGEWRDREREHTHYYATCMGIAMGLGLLGYTVYGGRNIGIYSHHNLFQRSKLHSQHSTILNLTVEGLTRSGQIGMYTYMHHRL